MIVLPDAASWGTFPLLLRLLQRRLGKEPRARNRPVAPLGLSAGQRDVTAASAGVVRCGKWAGATSLPWGPERTLGALYEKVYSQEVRVGAGPT